MVRVWDEEQIELEMQRQLRVAEWKAAHPEYPEQLIEANSHPFTQVGPFIKVALYDQWDESKRSWGEARIGTIYGLRFGKRGLGVTFRGRRPCGLVSFGAVSQASKDDGRTV